MTLADLRAAKQTPMMMSAIDRAIAHHGADAVATIAAGLPTYRKGSNFHSAAQAIGAKGTNYSYYLGPHRMRGTEGWCAVIVVTAV